MPLLRFRGQLRPVILAGSKQFVDRAVRGADPYMIKLRERGVSGMAGIIGAQWGE